MKNHERVLCIQTALILTKNPYTSILVTAPFRKRMKNRNVSLFIYLVNQIFNVEKTGKKYFHLP